MISNTTAIAEVFSRIDHKFDLMYSKRALCIGMWERAWKKVSSQRRAKILLPWRRITKRLALRPQRERERKKDTATSSERSTLSRAMFAARSLSFRETVLYHLAAQNCCAVTIIFICMPK